MDKVRIIGYMPGAIGKITELHATYYHKRWNFGLFFERKVATDMSEFLGRFDETTDGFWLAAVKDQIVGAVAIDGRDADNQGAHLRWFIVAPKWRGQGIGKTLLGKAVGFCRKRLFARVYLWTFSGLDTARHLYEKQGFILIEQRESNQWDAPVTAQRFELVLDGQMV